MCIEEVLKYLRFYELSIDALNKISSSPIAEILNIFEVTFYYKLSCSLSHYLVGFGGGKLISSGLTFTIFIGGTNVFCN